MNYEYLLEEAKGIRDNSYTPYTCSPSGAVILCTDGSRHKGATIEHTNDGHTRHAAEVALLKAVYKGKRDFDAIAVFTPSDDPLPCDTCLSILTEHCDDDLTVIVDGGSRHSLRELTTDAIELAT